MADAQKTDSDRFDREPRVESTDAARLSMDADTKALIMEGWAALVKGDGDAAVAKFDQALGANSGSIEACYGRAAALKALGRKAEAIEAFEQAIARISSTDTPAERVRITMLKHMAESALRDLKGGEGKGK